MSAVFSPCRTWRYRLDRPIGTTQLESGLHYGFCGINASTAAEDEEDQTTKKWWGFTIRNGGSRYTAFNPYAFCSTDVHGLALTPDPIGPENDRHIAEIIAEVDVLVPCWGNLQKIPKLLRPRVARVLEMILASGKPVKTFGLNKGGDPTHPQMLGYDTPLIPWSAP